MISVKSFMNSIKITWIRRIFNNPNSNEIAWINHLNDNLCETLMNFLIFGNEFLKNLESKIDNSFWKDVFRAYYSLRELCEQEFSFFQPLWHNKLIKVNKKPICYTEWVDRKILYVYDLLDENGQILDYANFCRKFQFHPPFTSYYGILTSIRKNNWNFDFETFTKCNPFFPKHLNILTKSLKGSRDFYDVFVSELYKT